MYKAAMEKLTRFCEARGIRKKAKFSSSTIECFVVDLHDKKLSPQTIQTTLSGLRHHCRANSIAIKFDTERLKLVLRGIENTSAPSTRTTNHVTTTHLAKLCQATVSLYSADLASMYNAIFCLGFYGLLRPCEMSKSKGTPHHQLKRESIKFTTNYLVLKFETYKHSRKMVSIKVKRQSHSPHTCPWQALYSYLTAKKIAVHQPLFPLHTSDLQNILQECCSYANIQTRL